MNSISNKDRPDAGGDGGTPARLDGVRCLVLGGTGFIGSHLCRSLVEHGAIVRSFATHTAVANGNAKLLQGQVQWVRGSFGDADLVRRALHDVEVVFHLISTSLPASSNENIPLDLSSNVLPTLHMLEAAKNSGVRKVIFVSSGGAIYGVPQQTPIPEDHPLNPICAYGIHKLAIEKYLHLGQHLWGLDYGVLRPSNPYGVGQPVNRPQGVIARFMHKILNHEPVEVWGNGSVVRDYIYVDDLIRAGLTLMGHQGPSRIFNVGTGEGSSLLEIISAIEDITGEKAEVRFRDARNADVPANVLDISRARGELKWRPAVDLRTGIRRTFEHGACLQQTF